MLAKFLLLFAISNFNPNYEASCYITNNNSIFIACPTTIRNVKIITSNKKEISLHITNVSDYEPLLDIEMFKDKLFLSSEIYFHDTNYLIKVNDQIKTYYFVIKSGEKTVRIYNYFPKE